MEKDWNTQEEDSTSFFPQIPRRSIRPEAHSILSLNSIIPSHRVMLPTIHEANRRPSSLSRAINGILAMTEFKEQFGTKCYDSKHKLEICTEDSSIIVAILSAGTALGALLAAPAGDSLGRRKTLLLAVGIFCIGSIFQVCAQATDMLLAGRYVALLHSDNHWLTTPLDSLPVLVSAVYPFWYLSTNPKWHLNGSEVL